MTKCNKCETKIVKQLWLVNEIAFCSPRCERGTWDSKAQKWSTKFNRFGDKKVELWGVAGFVNEPK